MSSARNPRHTARTLLAFGAVLALLGGPQAAAEVEGPCSASFNGVPHDQIDTLQSPLELESDDVLRFHGTDETGTQRATVGVELAMVTVQDATSVYGPVQGEFSASLDLDDVSRYGVGLFRVRGTTDNCTVEAWVRITGRFPLGTLIGLTAGGLALAGFAAQMTAIAARRKHSALLAAAAGLVTGVGAAGVGQQFGRLQLSIPSIAIAAAAAAVLGALIAAVLKPRRSQGRWARFRERRGRERASRYQARLETARLDALRREEEPESADAPVGQSDDEPTTEPDPPATPPSDTAEDTPDESATGTDEPEEEPPLPEPEPAPIVREAVPIGAEPDAGPGSAPGPLPAQPDDEESADGEPTEAEPPPEPGPEPDAVPAGPDAAGPVIEGPAWCYVLAPVDVFGLEDHSRAVAMLHPGTWYLAKRQVGGWVQVAAGDGTEGWVARSSIHRLG